MQTRPLLPSLLHRTTQPFLPNENSLNQIVVAAVVVVVAAAAEKSHLVESKVLMMKALEKFPIVH